MNRKSQFCFAISALILIVVACGVGSFLGARYSINPAMTVPLPLKADTSTKGKTLSMATGSVSAGVEGLYLLDHATGNLQCWIMNPRTGAVGGIFQTNVLQDLGVEKAGDFVMCSGGFIFQGGVGNNAAPSMSIIYVADETTGNVVGYSFNFNRSELNRGATQNGVLQAVCKGPTRGSSEERDQGN